MYRVVPLTNVYWGLDKLKVKVKVADSKLLTMPELLKLDKTDVLAKLTTLPAGNTMPKVSACERVSVMTKLNLIV